jgi:hypothetical protein
MVSRHHTLTKIRIETMFKKTLIAAALIAVIGALVFGAVNIVQANNGNWDGNTANVSQQNNNLTEAGRGPGGNSNGQGASNPGTNAVNNLPASPDGTLSAEEADALLYMREEEKLAQDVYAALYTQWGLPIFQNISQSETVHTEAVKTLLDRYGLSDPASTSAGVFTNPDLQKLYTDLVARGSQSLSEALKVGGAIEEIDILDLQERLAQTDQADTQQVFNNLLNGSYNHLNAFASTLETQTGETYQPQYLDSDAYQSIISSGIGNGAGNGNGSGTGNGGGAGNGGGKGNGHGKNW